MRLLPARDRVLLEELRDAVDVERRCCRCSSRRRPSPGPAARRRRAARGCGRRAQLEHRHVARLEPGVALEARERGRRAAPRPPGRRAARGSRRRSPAPRRSRGPAACRSRSLPVMLSRAESTRISRSWRTVGSLSAASRCSRSASAALSSCWTRSWRRGLRSRISLSRPSTPNWLAPSGPKRASTSTRTFAWASLFATQAGRADVWARAGGGVKPAARNASVETANRDQGFMKGPRSRGRFESRNGARLYDRRSGSARVSTSWMEACLDGQWTGKDDAGPLGQIRTSTKRTRGDMRTRASVFAATLLGAVTLDGIARCPTGGENGREEVGRQRAAGRGGDGQPRRAHGNVDERRREPRRQDARLRPARRPVHAARSRAARRRRSPTRSRGRCSRASRPDGKRIAYVSDAGGGDNVWVMNADGTGARAVSTEDFRLVNNPVWHPVRRLRRRAQALQRHAQPRIGRDLALPRERREGRRPQREAELAEGPRRAGVLARRPLRLLLAGHDPGPHVRVQQELARADLRRSQRLDTTDGTIEAVRDRAGRRRAAGALAGRQAPRLRAARWQASRRSSSRTSRRGEERPGVGRARARPAGGVGDPRRLPGLRVAPRGARGRRLGAGQALARGRGVSGKAREIPFHVRDTREVRKAVRFTTAVAPDTFDVRQLRWVTVFPAGDRVVYSALGHLYVEGPARRHAAPAHDAGRPLRAVPERLARRRAHRVRDLGRRRRSAACARSTSRTGRETVLTKQPGKYLEPRFSPDGRTVVFTRSRGGYLHVALAGHRDRRLPRAPRTARASRRA